MGNHEYCAGCGASDFHIGYTCEQAYPEGWARKEKERKAKKVIVDEETARVTKLVARTIGKGKKAVVARMLGLRTQQREIRKRMVVLKAQEDRLYNEAVALRKHCPHPKRYYEGGFAYSSCVLCGELF